MPLYLQRRGDSARLPWWGRHSNDSSASATVEQGPPAVGRRRRYDDSCRHVDHPPLPPQGSDGCSKTSVRLVASRLCAARDACTRPPPVRSRIVQLPMAFSGCVRAGNIGRPFGVQWRCAPARPCDLEHPSVTLTAPPTRTQRQQMTSSPGRRTLHTSPISRLRFVQPAPGRAVEKVASLAFARHPPASRQCCGVGAAMPRAPTPIQRARPPALAPTREAFSHSRARRSPTRRSA